MRRVRLHHDGATGGERRHGVSARHREGKGEVARAEDSHRSQGNEHPSQVRFREGLSLRLRVVYRSLDPGAFAYDVGEHANLARRPSALAREPLGGQRRLRVRPLDQLVAKRLDP
jgi:hypothetical protein